MFTKRLCLTVLFAAAAACSSNPAPGAEGAPAATGRSADVITADELSDPSIASGDLLQAIERLRPRFLMTRGAISGKNASAGSVHVSIDGGPLVDVSNLNRLRPNQVLEVRYLSSSDAAQRFGTNAGSGGVILVKSR